MQLTEQELFEVLVKRYHEHSNSVTMQATTYFAEALQAFVEKFTNNKHTISINNKDRVIENVVTITSNGPITFNAEKFTVKGETK